MNRSRSHVVEVFSEERAAGFSTIAPLRLVWALLTDASGGGVDRERVEGIKEVVVHLDGVMAGHVDGEREDFLRARALTPGLLVVLDELLGGDPHRAWTSYTCLLLLHRAGLLGPSAGPTPAG